MFQGLSAETVNYMSRDLTRAFEQEARLRDRVRRYAQALLEEVDKMAQPDRSYRRIEPSYSGSLEDYNAAVAKTQVLVEAFSNVVWSSDQNAETPTLQAAFEAWVLKCREAGEKRA